MINIVFACLTNKSFNHKQKAKEGKGFHILKLDIFCTYMIYCHLNCEFHGLKQTCIPSNENIFEL